MTTQSKEADSQIATSAPLAGAQPLAGVPAGGRVAKTKDTLSVLVTALPIVGAVGTFFVWAAANFYVGDVEITPNRSYNALTVKVYDAKGQEATFHSPKFQLMPGSYHIVMNADDSKAQHADAKIAFQQKANITLNLPEDSARSSDEKSKSDAKAADDNEESKSKTKRWWQFWRSKNPE
ncbi:MAG: hypothetical protein IAF58_19480 [Leptolyngbya sp.]|nr:hypothetical protein [Candidatus Melainabacteria bacterium]